MNYDDDLERARTRGSHSRKAEPKRRDEKRRTAGHNSSDSEYRRRDSREKELTIIGEGRSRAGQTMRGNSGSVSTDGRSRRQNSGARETAASSARNTRKSKNRTRKIIIIIVEILALLGILAFIAYSYFNRKINLIQRLPFDENTIKNVELSDEKQEQMKGYWTIAVFGVDDRGTVIGKGTHADVNIICNINQDTGEVNLVSVYRDSYLNISDKNSYNKINQAYFDGGPEQAVKALNKNLDLNITDYATFNWKAVAQGINILGGVDVEISKKEFYYINAFITETVKATGLYSTQLKKAGMNHLDGVQAVAYGRLRLMDTDYQRTERQRKIISLAFDKAKKADWATLNNIMETVFPQVATSIDVKDIADAAWNIKKYHIGESGGFPANLLEATMGKKGACVIPNTLESNVTELHKFLFDDQDYVPTETVKAYSKKIAEDYGNRKNAAKSTEKATKAKETEEVESTSAQRETDLNEHELKESGSNVHGSTSAGETTSASRPGGDASGWETWGTDQYGNPADPAWGTTTAPANGTSGSTGPGGEALNPYETSPYQTSSPYETPPAYETTSPYPTSPNRPGGTTTPGDRTPGTTMSPQNNAPGGNSGTSPTMPSTTAQSSQTGPGGGNTAIVTPGTSASYPGGGQAEVPGAGMN